jgi:hypothetical protein
MMSREFQTLPRDNRKTQQKAQLKKQVSRMDSHPSKRDGEFRKVRTHHRETKPHNQRERQSPINNRRIGTTAREPLEDTDSDRREQDFPSTIIRESREACPNAMASDS